MCRISINKWETLVIKYGSEGACVYAEMSFVWT